MIKHGKRYVTPGKAARLLGRSSRAVQKMVNRGEFESVWRSNTGRMWIQAEEVRSKLKSDQ